MTASDYSTKYFKANVTYMLSKQIFYHFAFILQLVSNYLG